MASDPNTDVIEMTIDDVKASTGPNSKKKNADPDQIADERRYIEKRRMEGSKLSDEALIQEYYKLDENGEPIYDDGPDGEGLVDPEVEPMPEGESTAPRRSIAPSTRAEGAMPMPSNQVAQAGGVSPIEQLMSKVLSGQATPEEQMVLQQMMQQQSRGMTSKG